MKLFGKEISKSQVKAVGTLAAVVGVGAALVYGGSYIVKGGSDLLSDPKRAVMVSINESDSLSLEDRSYLFDYNASLIPVENGLVVCNSKIYERASPEQQLDILLAQIDDTDVANYDDILGAMAKKVGGNLYESITGIFQKGE